MVYKILLCGREYTYQLRRKRVKNLNLRIRPDGSIFVSAAPWVSQAAIEAFLHSRAEFIRRAVARSQPVPPRRFCSGARVYVWGEPLSLEIRSGPAGVTRQDGRLMVSLPDPTDAAAGWRLVDGYVLDGFRAEALRVCREIYPPFAALGAPYPQIRFRKMKSRWGSCNPSAGRVTLSTRLAAAPPECLTYVAVHEFCHFLHPDHSPAFHDAMTRFLPDWKARRALLRQPEFFAAGGQMGD